MNDDYEYRRKYVEIYVENGDYVEFDVKKKKEIVRRPATLQQLKDFPNRGTKWG